MKAQLKYFPDLRACVLEDRLVPVAPNLGLGAIVLTTGGYVLTSAFPGIAIPASFVMTGSAGISGMQPGICLNPRLTDRLKGEAPTWEAPMIAVGNPQTGQGRCVPGSHWRRRGMTRVRRWPVQRLIRTTGPQT